MDAVSYSSAPAAIGPRAARGMLAVLPAAFIAVMASTTVALALSSDHLADPVATALYKSYLVVAPALVGALWLRRRPASRFGPLLLLFALVAWPVAWQSSDDPLLHTLGAFGDLPFLLVTFLLCLAFPLGRLAGPERAVLVVLGLAVAVSTVGRLLLPSLSGAGPLSACEGACPGNPLQVADAPSLAATLGDVASTLALAATLAAMGLVAFRLATATRPRRRALAGAALTSLLFLPVFFAFHTSRVVLDAGPATLEDLEWALVAARVLLPLGFALALLQADLFAGAALKRLLRELLAHPSPERFRRVLAGALDDASLRLGFYDAASGTYREHGGDELRPPPAGSGRRWLTVARDGDPIVAMDVDAALDADPELLEAARSATLLAVEHGHLEGELRRIERDLHDSAQQRLVALRVHLGIAAERLADRPEQRAVLDSAGEELGVALEELRGVTRGAHNATLEGDGVAGALREVTRRSAMPVDLLDQGLGRLPAELERAIYFASLEALQNAAKHGGPGVRAVVRLWRENGDAAFSVEDDGPGFDPAAARRGAGLRNLAERVQGVGGTLAVDAAPGRGTRVAGRVPL